MRRRDFLAGSGGGLLYALQPSPLLALSPPSSVANRGLCLAVDPRCNAEIHSAIGKLVTSAASHPLLSAMAAHQRISLHQTSQLLFRPDQLAYNHVIIIGRPDDSLLIAASQREASISSNRIYVFGFGAFQGDCGYIESDRNPFLHAARIASAPYETELITITGTSDRGILAAIQSFEQKHLVNGIVAANGWVRTETTLLDRDPLPLPFSAPALAPANIAGYTRIGITQAAEDEYRGVLSDTGVLPQLIWRAKYYRPGAWDGGGAAAAFNAYCNGLHRRAYGSTLWLARFADASQAANAAPKIAAAAKLNQNNRHSWTGVQPAYANGTYPGERSSSGPLSLTQQGVWLIMSTLEGSSAFESLTSKE